MTDTPDTPDNSDTPTGGDRIAKVIARAGLASRRDAERMIIEGRVTVNGQKIDSPALDVTPDDRVTVDGKRLDAPQETRLWLYFKPSGLVTSEADEKGRQTVFDALPRDLPRVMSVGRLDLNSEGLLLLTNDGALKRRLELPTTGWLRRYRVRVNGTPNDLTFAPLRRGVTIDGEDFAPMEIKLDSQQGANAWLTVGIREGKNREIRRAMAHVGLTVNRLIRVGYGPFKLGDLEKNEVREVKRRVLRDQLGGLLTGEDEAERPRDFRARGAGGERPERPDRPERREGGFQRREDGPRKPRFEGERGPREGGFAARDGARKPRFGGGDKPGFGGPRKPRPVDEGGFQRREDGPRKPRFEGERGPREGGFAARDGARKPRFGSGDKPGFGGPRKPRPVDEGGFQRREDGPRKPRFEGERGPREGGFAARDGARKPRFGGGDKPGFGGPRKPRPVDEGGFQRREDGPRKPRFEGERGPREGGFAARDGARKPRFGGGDKPGFGGKPAGKPGGGPRGEGGFKGKRDGFGPKPGGRPGGKPGGFKPKAGPAGGRGPRPGGDRPGGPRGGKPRG